MVVAAAVVLVPVPVPVLVIIILLVVVVVVVVTAAVAALSSSSSSSSVFFFLFFLCPCLFSPSSSSVSASSPWACRGCWEILHGSCTVGVRLGQVTVAKRARDKDVQAKAFALVVVMPVISLGVFNTYSLNSHEAKVPGLSQLIGLLPRRLLADPTLSCVMPERALLAGRNLEDSAIHARWRCMISDTSSLLTHMLGPLANALMSMPLLLRDTGASGHTKLKRER